jgi:dolichol-phosphate mannosyltransferase
VFAPVKPIVVLPTYNEAENILIVLGLVREAAPEADVLVVDDGSPDGTADLAEKWGAEHGGLQVLRRTEKAGLGSAYRAGFAQGLEQGYDILIEMDSDLQHDPAMLPALIHAVADGADLAIGSRYVPGGAVPGWKLSRRFISQAGNLYAGIVLGMHVRDATAGFRAFAAPALAAIDLGTIKADGYGFQIEMAYTVSRNGGRIVEVPITFGKRERGTSKMSSNIVFEALASVTWWGLRDRVLRPIGRLFGRGKRA